MKMNLDSFVTKDMKVLEIYLKYDMK